jgi:hypothetical protein
MVAAVGKSLEALMRQLSVKAILFCMLMTLGPTSAWAAGNEIQLRSTLTKDEFHSLSRELGFALSYFPLAPAAPLGVTGFDIGIEATAVDISERSSYWQKAVKDGNPPSMLIVPKLHAQKGLPFNLDVGIIYSTVPDTNISLLGGELKWAFIEGGVAMPALALRGSYTKLLGVDELDLDTYGADLSISKRALFMTPYAGIGAVWIKSSTDSRLLATQFNETQSLTKAFVGLKMHLPLFSLVAEADFSTVAAYSLRANLSF